MRSAGLKNITAKHLGATTLYLLSPGLPKHSSGVAVTLYYDWIGAVYSRDGAEASKSEASSDVGRV